MLPPTSGFFPPFPIRRNNRFQHLETAVTIIGNDRYLYWEQASLSKISQMIFL